MVFDKDLGGIRNGAILPLLRARRRQEAAGVYREDREVATDFQLRELRDARRKRRSLGLSLSVKGLNNCLIVADSIWNTVPC